jgi:hypothetical protein
VKQINEFDGSGIVSHAHQSSAWDNPQVIGMANLKASLIRKEQREGFKGRLVARLAYLFSSHERIVASKLIKVKPRHKEAR